jgi:hypothetical protein
MRFTITVNARTPSNLRWGTYTPRDAIDQAAGLVASGTRGVKITTENGRAFDLDEFKRFIHRMNSRGDRDA